MKILSNQIKPLIPINKDNSIYGSLDIETVSVRGSLYPYAAGFRINNILVIKHAFSYLNKDLHGCNVVIDCIKELLSIHNIDNFIEITNSKLWDGLKYSSHFKFVLVGIIANLIKHLNNNQFFVSLNLLVMIYYITPI